MTGNNGTTNVAYVQSTDDRAARRPDATSATAGLFRDGTKTGSAATADFSMSYDAYNSDYQGSAGGVYTVRTGDTLASIAQALWGDANLWYKLAAANGMSGNAALIEGQTLTLPTGVTKSGHSASTFKPYDPTDALGDLSPTTPKPPKKPKCGMLGQILVAAIAIAVSALTYGALAGASPTILGAIGAGAVSGAAGGIASQGFGVATGIQNSFSWKGVGLAAIGGAVGGGLGASGLFGDAASGAFKAGTIGIKSGVIDAVVRGAVTNAITQGIGVATGLQSKFDFAGVAAAGIGAGVGQFVGARTTSLGKFGNDLAVGMASAIANAATRSAIKGDSFGDNLRDAIPDAIGGALG
ncbi:MAG: LysM peptidoglycan-binding domain-containing protein, partial [Sphingomonas sp.]